MTGEHLDSLPVVLRIFAGKIPPFLQESVQSVILDKGERIPTQTLQQVQSGFTVLSSTKLLGLPSKFRCYFTNVTTQNMKCFFP